MGTKRGGQRRFPHTKSDLGLEPLPLAVDQIDDRDWSFTDCGGQLDKVVEIARGRYPESRRTPVRAGVLPAVGETQLSKMEPRVLSDGCSGQSPDDLQLDPL